MPSKIAVRETAESMAAKQRDISVSEFFLKNRHLLGFDNPRRALLTAVKEAVDNALDACEEGHIVPEIAVEIVQTAAARFTVSITDNGPGIVRAQIPKIFAKLLYGSKFHRLRMSRGQQGIGISAAGMYGQLTTGSPTRILSLTRGGKAAHALDVQIDTAKNTPAILSDDTADWRPRFFVTDDGGTTAESGASDHGTCVSIEMEAAYVRGRLSVDEYLRQTAIVNPHLTLHYRVRLLPRGTEAAGAEADGSGEPDTRLARRARPTPQLERVPSGGAGPPAEPNESETEAMLPAAPGAEPAWTTWERALRQLPPPPQEIKPHPHGVELGLLMQMLRNTPCRTLRAALQQDFSRVSGRTADDICARAGLDPHARPATRIGVGPHIVAECC